MTFIGEKRFHGHGDRDGEGKYISHRDMRRGGDAVGFVLAAAMMPPSDLVLPGEPRIVVVGAAGIENPLAEALAHSVEIRADGFAGFLIAEIGEKMRRVTHKAVPDVEDRFDLIPHHVMRLAERRDIFLAE